LTYKIVYTSGYWQVKARFFTFVAVLGSKCLIIRNLLSVKISKESV